MHDLHEDTPGHAHAKGVPRPASSSFSWEEKFPRSWDAIKEDEEGGLLRTHRQMTSGKDSLNYWNNQVRQYLKGHVKRGMVRHMCVAIDGSMYALERDWVPSRWDGILSALRHFTLEYFDQ